MTHFLVAFFMFALAAGSAAVGYLIGYSRGKSHAWQEPSYWYKYESVETTPTDPNSGPL